MRRQAAHRAAAERGSQRAPQRWRAAAKASRATVVARVRDRVARDAGRSAGVCARQRPRQVVILRRSFCAARPAGEGGEGGGTGRILAFAGTTEMRTEFCAPCALALCVLRARVVQARVDHAGAAPVVCRCVPFRSGAAGAASSLLCSCASRLPSCAIKAAQPALRHLCFALVPAGRPAARRRATSTSTWRCMRWP